MPSFLYRPGHPLANPKGFVTKEDYWAHKYYTEPDLRMLRGNEPVVINYIADEMPPTRHMIDGKLYTSKRKFRNETRARGCIEVGNETASMLKPKKYIPSKKGEIRRAIKDSIRALKENTIPEGERAIIKRHAERTDYLNRNRRRKAN